MKEFSYYTALRLLQRWASCRTGIAVLMLIACFSASYGQLNHAEGGSQVVSAICRERWADPLGSTPIDVMRRQPTLPTDETTAAQASARALRLLPAARSLTIAAIQRLGQTQGLSAEALDAAARRVQMVTEIRAEPELRDNAMVNLTAPTLIRFGTIFLAGLPSDEAMIAIMAHELTHLADGKEDSLQPMFSALGKQAAHKAELDVSGRRAEELVCDLVGTVAARLWVLQQATNEPLARRWARGLQHNCVDDDHTDQAHLSPRDTLRGVLALDDALREGLLSGTFTVAAPLAREWETAPRHNATRLRLPEIQ